MTIAAGDLVFYTANTTADVAVMSTGNSIHNNCWTVAHALKASTATRRTGISGILGSNQTCLRTVVDGYSLSGLVAISVAGSNYSADATQAPNAGSPLNIANTVKYSLWKSYEPYNTTDASPFDTTANAAVPMKGINVGSPVSIYQSNNAFNYVFTLISASEYYYDS